MQKCVITIAKRNFIINTTFDYNIDLNLSNLCIAVAFCFTRFISSIASKRQTLHSHCIYDNHKLVSPVPVHQPVFVYPPTSHPRQIGGSSDGGGDRKRIPAHSQIKMHKAGGGGECIG